MSVVQWVHHGHIAVYADEGQRHHGHYDENVVSSTLQVAQQVGEGGDVRSLRRQRGHHDKDGRQQVGDGQIHNEQIRHLQMNVVQ